MTLQASGWAGAHPTMTVREANPPLRHPSEGAAVVRPANSVPSPAMLYRLGQEGRRISRDCGSVQRTAPTGSTST